MLEAFGQLTGEGRRHRLVLTSRVDFVRFAEARKDDPRDRALALGHRANILEARGQLDEALRIRKDEEIPVYERLGDVRELLVARVNTAITLLHRRRPDDRPEILGLLRDALAAAREHSFPVETRQIEDIMQKLGLRAP